MQNLKVSASFSVRLHYVSMECICIVYKRKPSYLPRKCTIMFMDSHPTCLGLIRLLSSNFVNIRTRDV
jgi:hypothetical protein